MFKKLFFSSFLFIVFVVIIFPSRNENTELFQYCYSFEKILSRNSFKKRNNSSLRVKSISNKIANFGVEKSKGDLIERMIDQYKTSKNNFILNIIPNELYCLSGYWIEALKPGTFESIFYKQSKKKINELKDIKDEVDRFFNEINSEYKILKNEFNNLF